MMDRLWGLLLRLLPSSPDAQGALTRYRVQASDLIRRVREILDAWAQLREIEPEAPRLANVAAVNRWELLRLSQQADQLVAPRGAGDVPRQLAPCIADAARGFQLLASGYRSHKSEAVCDGQTLVFDSLAALQDLSRRLESR